MKMIAVILLTMLIAQDKPAPTTEQKNESKTPVASPEVKPENAAPQVESTRSIRIRMKSGDGETNELRLSAEQVQQMITEKLSQTALESPRVVFENGAFYIKTDSFTFPMSGGGASGCLGEASRGKIAFHDPTIQRLIEAEKTPAIEKK